MCKEEKRYCVHGICGKYQSECRRVENISLFTFPAEVGADTAFLDRMHCYLPGWEIPKFRPEHFTNDYGFISDYLKFIRELRKNGMEIRQSLLPSEKSESA